MPATPCGLVAKSFFNDTFELWKLDDEGNESEKLEIISDNIAWSSDKEYKFHNTKNPENGNDDWKDYQWIDMED